MGGVDLEAMFEGVDADLAEERLGRAWAPPPRPAVEAGSGVVFLRAPGEKASSRRRSRTSSQAPEPEPEPDSPRSDRSAATTAAGASRFPDIFSAASSRAASPLPPRVSASAPTSAADSPLVRARVPRPRKQQKAPRGNRPPPGPVAASQVTRDRQARHRNRPKRPAWAKMQQG